MNTFTLSLSAIILYLTAVGTHILSLRSVSSFPKYLLLLFSVAAISFHGLALHQETIMATGINLGFFNAASLISWVIALLLLLTLLHKPVDNLIVVLFPLAALTIGFDGYFHTEHILPHNQNFGVIIHIFSSLLAYSLLSISAFQAVFLAVQDYQLHHKRPGWVMQRLPPLQVMETLLFQIMALGVILLTISLFSGFWFLSDIFAQHLVHKTVLSIIAWWVFIILLWGHWQYGWRGRIAIYWSLSGFFFLMLAYFGSKFVLELILKR